MRRPPTSSSVPSAALPGASPRDLVSAAAVAPTPVDRSQLLEVVDVLSTEIGPMTDILVSRILRDEPTYESLSVVALEDLRRSCEANLERVVEALRDEAPETSPLYEAAAITGRLRATQGMPLDAVLHSYRIGGRVILEAVSAIAARRGRSDDGRLLGVAIVVWETMDRFSNAAARAYRDEELRLKTEHRHQQQRDVLALLGGGMAEHETRVIADRLGLADDVPMVVVVVLLDENSPRRFSLADALASRGQSSVWAVSARGGLGMEIGLVPLTAAGTAELVRVAETERTSRTGLSPVFLGLQRIAAAARLAEIAARTLTITPAVAALEDRLPEAFVLSAPELSDLIVEQTIGRISRSSGSATLLETIQALLDNAGSHAAAAAQLYCHRNTVANRVSRIVQLTGHDPLTPRGALVWSLAMLAEQQRLALGR